MGWKDELRPASYRGTPFHVRTRTVEGGKRTASHEIFNRDLPYIEELGRRARSFSVTAYVVGDDYLPRRDAVIQALETRASGELQLPYDDPLQAVCTSWRLTESSEEGGFAALDLTFEESGPSQRPRATRDPRDDSKRASSIYREQADAQLEEDLLTTGVPEPAREATATEVESWGARLRTFRLFADDIQAKAEQAARVNRLISQAVGLALEPANLVIATREAANGVLAGLENGIEALYAYRTLFGVPPSAREPAAGALASEAAWLNSRLVNFHFRSQVLGLAVEAAADASWESLDQVEEARGFLLAEVEALEPSAGDLAYQALMNLKAALLRVLPVEDEDLPYLADLTLGAPMPSLVVAYQLYDNARLGQQIVDRNRPRHPGFLPAGEPLQVLVHG